MGLGCPFGECLGPSFSLENPDDVLGNGVVYAEYDGGLSHALEFPGYVFNELVSLRLSDLRVLALALLGLSFPVWLVPASLFAWVAPFLL